MVNVNTALIGLGIYFGALFVFGLSWRRRESAQRKRSDDSCSGMFVGG